MASESLQNLEKRINTLENVVFGDDDKDKGYPQVVDTLCKIDSRVNEMANGKKKTQDMFKRLNEINNLLDPSYVEHLSMKNDAKEEIILSDENYIKEQVDSLQKVKETLPVLDSEHIKHIPSYQNKLYSLSQIHIDQQDKADKYSGEVKDILSHYNNIVDLISKQFIAWDQNLTKHEALKNIKVEED